MPQPAVLDDLQEPLLKSYRRAWARVQAEQEALVTNPLAYRRKIRLAEMRKTIEAAMDEMDEQAGEWLAQQLPKAYSAGMVSAPGASSPTWTQIHQEAVGELSEELFRELLQATDGVRDSTKRLVRTVGRDQALQKAIIGKTAKQASQEMRRVLESKGIHSVVYSNGTKHGLAEYTQVAMRTTTAKAYNRGTLGAHADVGFFEIFDGPNCGLESHNDPRMALGMVVDRVTAQSYLLSHPQCRRSFGPRPDVESAEQATPTTTPEQRRAQLEQDAARGDRGAQRVLERSGARSMRLSTRQTRIRV